MTDLEVKNAMTAIIAKTYLLQKVEI
ncbi:hypothetical protein [Clostridium ljungdahlii]